MGNKLSADQMAEVRKAFDHFDTDKNGQITLDELQKVLRTRRADLLKLLAECDMNEDGGISFDEFITLVQKKFVHVFHAIQHATKGGGKEQTVTIEQMKTAYLKSGLEVDDDDLQEFFNTLDINKDNRVSLEEFIVGSFLNIAMAKRYALI